MAEEEIEKVVDVVDLEKARQVELEIQSLERMDQLIDNGEFLDYCLEHSKTERHVFHRTHAMRIYQLAGIDTFIPEKKEFITHFDYNTLWPIIEKAKEKLGLNKREAAN